MAERPPQTYANRTRWAPMFHYGRPDYRRV